MVQILSSQFGISSVSMNTLSKHHGKAHQFSRNSPAHNFSTCSFDPLLCLIILFLYYILPLKPATEAVWKLNTLPPHNKYPVFKIFYGGCLIRWSRPKYHTDQGINIEELTCICLQKVPELLNADASVKFHFSFWAGQKCSKNEDFFISFSIPPKIDFGLSSSIVCVFCWILYFNSI